MNVLNPADNNLQTFSGFVLSIGNLLGLCLLFVDSTFMLLVEVITSQNDGEKREEGNAGTARRGGYMQEDLFSGVNNSGTQQVPDNTNQKKAE